jgi:hypothetical protein
LNRTSNSGIELGESVDEHESNLEEQLGQISLLAVLPEPPSQSTDDVAVGGLLTSRTKMKSSSSLDFMQKTSDDREKNRGAMLQPSPKTAKLAKETLRRIENQAGKNTQLHSKQAGEMKQEGDAGRSRRMVSQSRKNSQCAEGGQEDSSFSFLYDWKKESPKKRW